MAIVRPAGEPLYLANGRLYNGVADIEAFDVTATGLSLPR
jgi:hypothetical protein